MSESVPPRVQPVGPPQIVPVFNCRVIVAPRDEAGKVTVRAAEIDGLWASGDSEREALQKLVAAFKQKAAAYVAARQEIPWQRPGQLPGPGERELFLAVHL